jgi:hypothetical protein
VCRSFGSGADAECQLGPCLLDLGRRFVHLQIWAPFVRHGALIVGRGGFCVRQCREAAACRYCQHHAKLLVASCGLWQAGSRGSQQAQGKAGWPGGSRVVNLQGTVAHCGQLYTVSKPGQGGWPHCILIQYSKVFKAQRLHCTIMAYAGTGCTAALARSAQDEGYMQIAASPPGWHSPCPLR